jgi:hypothetical protein
MSDEAIIDTVAQEPTVVSDKEANIAKLRGLVGKEQAEKAELQKRLEKLEAEATKKKTEEEKAREDSLKEKQEFETLYKEQMAKNQKLTQERAILEMMRTNNVNPRFEKLVRSYISSNLQYAEDGEITNLEAVLTEIKTDYQDLFVTDKLPSNIGLNASKSVNTSNRKYTYEQALAILTNPNKKEYIDNQTEVDEVIADYEKTK